MTQYDPPLLTQADPDLATPHKFEYSLDGAPSVTKLPSGRSISSTHHPDTGLLESLSGDFGVIGYNYVPGPNPTGQLQSVSIGDSDHRLEFTYVGAVPTSQTLHGFFPLNPKLVFDYHPRQERKSETLEIGGSTQAIAYDYDEDGLLTGVHAPAGFAAVLDRTGPQGRVQQIAAGNVIVYFLFNEYDESLGQRVEVAGTPVYQLQLGRDAFGRIQTKTETRGAGLAAATATSTYQYDPAGRLWRVNRNADPEVEYTYDSNGNRTARKLGGATVEAAAFDEQDRVVSYGVDSLDYDPDGWVSYRSTDLGGGQSTTLDLAYDTRGNLQSATLDGGAVDISYVYDPLGRMVHRSRTQAGTTEDEYWLFGASAVAPVARVSSSGAVLTRYVYAGANLPVLIEHGGTTYLVVADHLGSFRGLVDLNAPAATLSYATEHDEYGRVISGGPPPWVPFGFAGGLVDLDTGLVRFGSRDYDPSSGRWTAKDPLGFDGNDGNLYGYVENDPVNRRDPLGLEFEEARDNLFVLHERTDALLDFSNEATLGRGEKHLARANCRITRIAAMLARADDIVGEATLAIAAAVVITTGTAGVIVVGHTAVAAALKRSLAGGKRLRANYIAGNKFRDEMADLWKSWGYYVQKEKATFTRYGPRFHDIVVWESHAAKSAGQKPIAYLETKLGNSVYTVMQKLKDDLINTHLGIPTYVVRPL